MANTPDAGLYTSNHGSPTLTCSRDLYCGRGSARHQSGIEFCAARDEAIHATRNNILCTHNLRNSCSGRGIAAPLNTDVPICDYHADSRQVSLLNAVEEILAGGLLRRIEKNEIRLAPARDESTLQATHLR